MGEMGIPKDSAAGRKEFERRMEARRWEDQAEQWRGVRRGWCLGDSAFRKELLAQMAEQAGASHYVEELNTSLAAHPSIAPADLPTAAPPFAVQTPCALLRCLW